MYLIIDLEATCWENNKDKQMETIEIGAVMVSNNYDMLDEFDTFVKPVVNKISEFCENLTSIKQSDVDGAPEFPEAMIMLDDWASGLRQHEFRSWGWYDKKQFYRDCEYWGVSYPFGNHRSIKHDFKDIHKVKSYGLKRCLKFMGMEFEGSPHRGIDDARNIARIFIKERMG